ncbi:hypothetical protein CGLO_07832 [Colletotrichum gloeosporioides Cg-14]|nr:hypothetical protein CGLO_07832 [Colletotrichum gloeosporioides Cg-14]
MPQEKKP